DVIVANAALQWVPDHLALLDRFVGWLAPGGCLAFQVPGNFRAPSHLLLSELRRDPRWAAEVGGGADRHLEVEDPASYATALLDPADRGVAEYEALPLPWHRLQPQQVADEHGVRAGVGDEQHPCARLRHVPHRQVVTGRHDLPLGQEAAGPRADPLHEVPH